LACEFFKITSKNLDDIIVTATSKSPTLVVKDPPIVEGEAEETGIERDEGGIDKEDRPETTEKAEDQAIGCQEEGR
jgi:hypothetical protein